MNCSAGMRGALQCTVLAFALSAGAAKAQTWVTVAMLPDSTRSSRYTAYQIDVNSIFRKGAFTYARGRYDYKVSDELVMAECSKGRLQLAADKTSAPPPYWIKRTNGFWYFDDPGSRIHGDRFDDGRDGHVFRSWMSGVLDFVCSS